MSVSATTPYTMELGILNCGAAQGFLRAARQSLVVPCGRKLCQNPSIRRKGSVTSSASIDPTQSQQGLLQRPPALRLGQSGPVTKRTQSLGPSSSVMAQPQLYVQQRQQQQQQQQQQSAEQQRQPQTRQQRPTLTRQQEQVPVRRQDKLSPASELRLPSQAQPQQSLALAVQRPRQRHRWPTMTNVMCNMVLYKQVVAQDDASTVGYVQALMVALNARRVVSLNIKPDTSYFSVANCNVPLTAMTQIGDVILIKDSKATSGSSPYDTAADVSGLVGLPVLAANGVELGKVRDFSFNPDSGELVGLKFDTLSYKLALPFDLRSRFPVLPEQAVTVWSVHTDDVQQISLSGVQLMPGVLPYQETTGLLNSVTSKISAFQDAAGKTLGKLPANKSIPVDGMSLVTDPAIERWERECGAASRKYYNLPAEASYEMVMAAVARVNGSPQIQRQPLQLPAATQTAYPTITRPKGQPQSEGSSGQRDPRSRHLRAASPAMQQSPLGPGQPAAPAQSHHQPRLQQPAPPQPFGTSGRSERADMRREIGEMRRRQPRQKDRPLCDPLGSLGVQGGTLQQGQTPDSPRLGGAGPAQDAPGGREFLQFAKPELFAHNGRQL